MLYRLKRHPLEVRALLQRTLVLTYALPAHLLQALLPPGLTPDTFGPMGFLAIALVRTCSLRPGVFPPFLGQDFFLAGYRIFSRLAMPHGRIRRGLRILRSYTDERRMVFFGNLLTHYSYRHAAVHEKFSDSKWIVTMRTSGGEADLEVAAQLDRGRLPADSPFGSEREARRFAGPLPFTFDYESQTQSIICIEGVRQNWAPRLVNAEMKSATFFRQPAFGGITPVLASAFFIENVPYVWKRGVRIDLSEVRIQN